MQPNYKLRRTRTASWPHRARKGLRSRRCEVAAVAGRIWRSHDAAWLFEGGAIPSYPEFPPES